MKGLFASRATSAAAAAVVVTLVAGGGYAIASGGGTIHACAKKSNGALRLANKCKKSEKGLSWGIQGPPGASGKNGTNGTNGTNGAAGQQGATGAPGQRGPSDGFTVQDATVATSAVKTTSLTLPAGQYIVTASMPAYNTNASPATISSCTLHSTLDTVHTQSIWQTLVASNAYATLTASVAQNLPSGGTVSMSCPAVTGLEYGPSDITAVQVGTLHG